MIEGYKDIDHLFHILRTNKNMLKTYKATHKKEWVGIYGMGDFAPTKIKPVFELSDKSGLKIEKTDTIELLKLDTIHAKCAISTTNIRDSHKDVHFPGCFTKTVRENKRLMHLKDHGRTQEDIISSRPNQSVVQLGWDDLGFNYKGITEILQFDSEIERQRNEYMFKQYCNGWVENHSIGMMYIFGKIFLCMKSDSRQDREERDNWDKFTANNQVVNLKDFEDTDPYFWAITELMAIEGSSVPLGSNYATPTISVGKEEPPVTPIEEPTQSTPKKAKAIFDY